MPSDPPIAELIPATAEQEPILANLLELYIHDFTDFLDVELRDNGRFGYDPLPLYWLEPNRHPFLVRTRGKLAGFVLLKQGSEMSGDSAVWDMVEFFILRRYRRQKLGLQIAHQVWTRFPGPWEVRVMQVNQGALRFWDQAISTFIGTKVRPAEFEKQGALWSLFSFNTARSSDSPGSWDSRK